jgi:hypothetical protein
MFVDEAVAAARPLQMRPAGNLGLTIPAAELLYRSRVRAVVAARRDRTVLAARRENDDFYSQGNYDYDAHAQVYWGGADPLGSQGYASVVIKSFQLLDAAREAKQLAGVFVSGVGFSSTGTLACAVFAIEIELAAYGRATKAHSHEWLCYLTGPQALSPGPEV